MKWFMKLSKTIKAIIIIGLLGCATTIVMALIYTEQLLPVIKIFKP